MLATWALLLLRPRLNESSSIPDSIYFDREGAEEWRTDERMRAVIETVRADPTARKLWDARDLPAITHPASEQPRRLYLAGRGDQEFAIRFIAHRPDELPSCRLMVVTPAEAVSSN
ncbi:hypothetical protein [Streptomyces sp. NBC_01518]|uniref:hypothetical protein n=1 Tax=Streptomyces sp. NBC_01518 TaxID=2903891 RepID=UPI00386E28F3